MDKNERKQWAKASPEVKRVGIKLLTIDMFAFKILEPTHPQWDDLNYIVRDMSFEQLMYKLRGRL